MDTSIAKPLMEPTADCERVIYTASDFTRNNLLYLQEAGQLTATSPHHSHREQLSSYLLIIVNSGCGSINYNNQLYKLKEGDAAIINCMDSYTHSTSDNPWSISWVHFYGNTINSIYKKYLKGSCVFTPQNPNSLRITIQEICLLANSNDYLCDIKIHSKLTSLISLILDDAFHKPLQKNSHIKWNEQILKIRNYIDSDFQSHITLDDLTSKFYINKFTLIRLFKDQYGMSPIAYLLQLRITKAKELLRFTDISVDEVAWRTGFPDGNYFSRAFKKIENISPSEYRKYWVTKGELN